MDRLPEIRRILGDSLQQARFGLAALFLDKEESAIDKQTARTAGAFYHALLSGLISQFLIDPEHALSARDLTEALRMTAALMLPTHEAFRTKPKRTRKKKKRQG
jgi:RecB family exonuclease